MLPTTNKSAYITYLHENDGVRPVPFGRTHQEISMEIPCIQTGYGQPISVSCQRNRMGIRLAGLWGSGVHVLEQLIVKRAGNASALVRQLEQHEKPVSHIAVKPRHSTYFNANIFFSPGDGHHDRRILIGGRVVVLDHSPHGILEQLEQHVIQM